MSNNTKGYVSGSLQPGNTELFDQTTLFNLNANEDNGRYSFFSMDAGLGVSDGGFGCLVQLETLLTLVEEKVDWITFYMEYKMNTIHIGNI